MGMMTRRNVKARAVNPAPAVTEKQPVNAVQEDVHAERETVQEVAEPLAEQIKAKGLSKTEINRMTTADLQELAKSFGVEDADEMSGSQIKRLLCAALEE